MDFNKFDTVSIANQGTWLHLKSPIDGELLYAMDKDKETGESIPDMTKPCRVRVLGAEGRIAQDLVNTERAKLSGDDTENPQERIKREAMTLIVGFENINRGDAPAEAPKDNDWFCSMQKAIARPGVHPGFSEQVRHHSMTRMHELGNVRGGL